MNRLVAFFLAACLPAIALAFQVPVTPIQRQPLSRPVLLATPAPFAGGILGRFRKKRKVEDQPVNPIAIGEAIKDADVERLNVLAKDANDEEATENEPVSIREVMGTGKAILLGMPGAFTPTCTQEHLPGYIKQAKRFANLGYKTIAVVTTNDKYVNREWMNSQGIGDCKDIIMLSDGDGDFVKSLGLAEDQGFGVGVRSQRFALVTDNGVATHLLTDEGMDTCGVTSADSILKLLTPAGDIADDGEVNPAIIGVVVAAIAVAVGTQSLGGAPTAPSSSSAPPAVMRTEPAKKSPKSESNFSLLNNFM